MITLRRNAAFLSFVFSLAPVAVNAQQLQPLNPPLKNWAAPLYWAPTPAEAERQRIFGNIGQRVAHPELSPAVIAQAASIFTAPGPLTFIAITPCRVMDTRTGQPLTGAFGPPSLAAFVNRQVPMPSSTTCSIPGNAGAYSLNITVVPPGPLSFLSVWPAGAPYPGVSTLNDPISGGVIANAAIVVTGTGGAIQMLASNPTDVIIDINGYYATPTDGSYNMGLGTGALSSNTTGLSNTGIGVLGLFGNTTGSNNTAIGAAAMQINTTGGNNTATGASALQNNTTGSDNTATGFNALTVNGTGSDNTASGSRALQSNTIGSGNSAFGAAALNNNTTGVQNTASGNGALQFNTTGGGNTSIGAFGLLNNTTGSDNTASGFDALAGNTTGTDNTANGLRALESNTIGSYNTAAGVFALGSNTAGHDNTANGYQALLNNTIGTYNSASGSGALQLNTTGFSNTAAGGLALKSNTTGYQNTASGTGALVSNTTGHGNAAYGEDALGNNTTGSENIAIGDSAALNVNGGQSNNILIGSAGVPLDANGIRIGTAGTQTYFFAAGIRGVTTNFGNAVPVMIDSAGQLGTTNSSRRFKEDIQDMGDLSSGLMRLRPVTYRFKQAYEDGSKPIDYGLIAEEVAQVYPDLAVKGADGQIETVQYQKLTPMLLNEVQKQNAQLQEQNGQLQNEVQLREEQNRKLEDRLAALEAVLSSETLARPGSSR